MKTHRILAVVGHYGSGKTEFAVNLTLNLRASGKKTALADIDIANPYFRSREQQEYLESKGIAVYSNAYKHDITQDLPAIDAAIRAPLEDADCHVVLDAGGDDSGARILNQFRKYLLTEEAELLCVINANRRETDQWSGALGHLLRIEAETGVPVGGLVSNTHMLRETTVEDIAKGIRLCREVSERLKASGRKVPLKYVCCVEGLIAEFTARYPELAAENTVYPMTLYMRPTWLDAPIDSR